MLRCNLCGAPIGPEETVVRVALSGQEYAYHAPECADDVVRGWVRRPASRPRRRGRAAPLPAPGAPVLSPLRAVGG